MNSHFFVTGEIGMKFIIIIIIIIIITYLLQ